VQQLDPVVRGGMPPDHGEGVVGGTPVHDDDLQVAVVLAAQRVQAAAEKPLLVERGHHDGDEVLIRHAASPPPSVRPAWTRAD
jgi:hypothetical protein